MIKIYHLSIFDIRTINQNRVKRKLHWICRQCIIIKYSNVGSRRINLVKIPNFELKTEIFNQNSDQNENCRFFKIIYSFPRAGKAASIATGKRSDKTG